MNFCPNCGEELTGTKKICASCGYDLQSFRKDHYEIDPSLDDSENRKKNIDWIESIDITKRSEDQKVMEDEEIKTSVNSEKNQLLPESLDCPKCGVGLVLEAQEREEGKFLCPNCNSNIDLTVSTQEYENTHSDSKLSKDVKLSFEDKGWIFVASLPTLGVVGLVMFIKYRYDGFNKKSNQVCLVTILSVVVSFIIAIMKALSVKG